CEAVAHQDLLALGRHDEICKFLRGARRSVDDCQSVVCAEDGSAFGVEVPSFTPGSSMRSSKVTLSTARPGFTSAHNLLRAKRRTVAFLFVAQSLGVLHVGKGKHLGFRAP